MQQVAGLPIYVGTSEQVERFVQPLAEALLVAADHIYEHCGGKTPRWMRVPKICTDVTRLNLVTATAKSSRRFESLGELTATCGAVSEDEAHALQEWLRGDEDTELVAHKAFIDLRAYVFDANRQEPQRIRFYESGLVMTPASDFVIQDQRKVVRKQRKDMFREPLATTAKGWDVFARRGARRNAHAGQGVAISSLATNALASASGATASHSAT